MRLVFLFSNFEHRQYVAVIIAMWRLLLGCGSYYWYFAVIIGLRRFFLVCGGYYWYVSVISRQSFFHQNCCRGLPSGWPNNNKNDYNYFVIIL